MITDTKQNKLKLKGKKDCNAKRKDNNEDKDGKIE